MITSRRPFEKSVCRAECAMAQGRQAGWILWINEDVDPATGNETFLFAAEWLRQVRG
jgi:hypothetical protein